MGRGRRRGRTALRAITLWDGRTVLGRWYCGMPAFRFQWAPDGLATRRQLRAMGLCPGGQDPYAKLFWKNDQRWADLFRVDLAKPKRVPSAAQAEALARAMKTRRTCRTHGAAVGYCVPTSTRECWECFFAREALESVREALTAIRKALELARPAVQVAAGEGLEVAA